MTRSPSAYPSRRLAVMLGAGVLALAACAGGPGPNWQFAAADAPGSSAETGGDGAAPPSGSPSELVVPLGSASSASPSASPSASASAGLSAGSAGTTGSGTATAAGAVAPAAADVSIVDFAFRPASITIREGGRVTFRNAGSAPHTVKLPSGESPILQAGQAHAQTFPVAGTFAYLCGLHPEMTGEVVVVADAGGSTGGGSTGGGTGGDAPAPTSTPTPRPATPTPPPSTAPAPGAAAPGSVRIVDSAFSPASLTVAAGATVTWTNNDDSRHTVRFGGSESPVLDTGQTYRRSFPTAGTFSYVCGLHSDMTGRVVVSASSGGGGGGGGGSTPAPTAAPTTDPVSVVLARVASYQDLLARAAADGFYSDRIDDLQDLANRVAAEVNEGDLDGATSKAEDLVEDTADAVEDDGMSTIGGRMIDAARAVQRAVAAI